jgi:transposase
MSGHEPTHNFAVVSTRRMRSLAEKQQIVGEATGPGANVSAVARRHGMTPSLLRRWIKSFKSKNQTLRSGFVPVAIAPPWARYPGKPSPSVSNASMIEVVLANGRVLRIGADIDLTALKRIAAALEDKM